VVEEGSCEAALLGDSYEPGMVLWHGRGCIHCGGTGYYGRMALHEVLVMDDCLRQAVLQQCERQEFSHIAVEQGMESLWQDGISKVKAGFTTLAEVRRVLYGS
jgi:type II secretory ATPase GspE/PulE/Tfp pilus assembly ATPase PilB-like protein